MPASKSASIPSTCYCVRCKANSRIDPKQYKISTVRGRRLLRATCSKCKGTMCRFLKST